MPYLCLCCTKTVPFSEERICAYAQCYACVHQYHVPGHIAIVAVVCTRPWAIPLAMINMRKSINGFPSVFYIGMGLCLAARAAGALLLYGKRSDWFFLGQDFAIRTVSMEMVYFLFLRAGKFKTSMARVPRIINYRYLLT